MTDDEIRQRAIEQYGLGDETTIDEDAVVSRNDEGGAWVAAWVYVLTGEKE